MLLSTKKAIRQLKSQRLLPLLKVKASKKIVVEVDQEVKMDDMGNVLRKRTKPKKERINQDVQNASLSVVVGLDGMFIGRMYY